MKDKKKFKISSRGAVGQLPLIIALLLLGIALPAGIKLVQQSQETRKSAVSGCNVVCTTDADCPGDLICYEVNFQKSPTPLPDSNCGKYGCGWCGRSCELVDPGALCPDVMPPEGKSCVCQDGQCTVVSDGGEVMGEQLLKVCRNPDCPDNDDCLCETEPTNTPTAAPPEEPTSTAAPPEEPTSTAAPPEEPTNTPASGHDNVPECANLSVNSVISEDKTLVRATASDGDGDLKEVTFAYAEYKENPTESYYCNRSNWSLIGTDNNGSDGWEVEWDVSEVSQGKYYVVANVYDEMDNWCTGNPVGTCNNATAECSNCNQVVSVISKSLSWDIETAAVCEDGSIANTKVSTWYVLWPPSPFEPVLEGSRIGEKTTTITSRDERNGIYVGMCEEGSCENDEFLPLKGSPPHEAINYGEYWNPYIPNAMWKRSELPEGSYRIEFQAPDSDCESQRQPDLTVSDISFNPSNPEVGEEVEITAEVKNIGPVAVKDFNTYLYIDPDQQPPSSQTPEDSYYGHHVWLIPDAKFDWTYTYIFEDTGEHGVYVWVDKDNEVKEGNEDNNLVNKTISVGSEGCKPCPDGSFAPEGTTSFNCDTDGKQNEDYGYWAMQYHNVVIQGNDPQGGLYGDYNCDGKINGLDHGDWFSKWCPTVHSVSACR